MGYNLSTRSVVRQDIYAEPNWCGVGSSNVMFPKLDCPIIYASVRMAVVNAGGYTPNLVFIVPILSIPKSSACS